MKSKFTYGILASILLILVAILVFKAKVFWSDNFSELSENEAKSQLEDALVLADGARYLENFYREPYEHELWRVLGAQCLKKYNLQESSAFRLACSSEILNCLEDYLSQSKKIFFSKNKTNISLDKAFGKLDRKKMFEVIYPFQDSIGSLELKSHQLKMLSSNGGVLEVALLSNCQESYLDERFYPIGIEPTDKSLEIKFDNIGKKIFLDKFQVRRGEVIDWANNTGKLKILNSNYKDSDAFKSYTNLNAKQMAEYCADHGKQLMQSHFYDAASFIPFDLKNKEPISFPRGNYYWVKKNTESWLHQFKIKARDELITEKNCSLVYTQECHEKFKYTENNLEPTWSGLYQVMGGPFEYMRNVLLPEENLRVSSKYFSASSSYQRMGMRANWDGIDFHVKNFRFEGGEKLPELSKASSIEVAFRCFREAK